MRVDSAADLNRVKKSGKIGILLGLQNSDQFRGPEEVDFSAGSDSGSRNSLTIRAISSATARRSGATTAFQTSA